MSEKKYNYTVEILPPEDFDEWAEHCGSIFDVGPAYFRRHFVSDPHRDYNSVFIIRNEERKIISTVRVFHRQVYIGGKTYKMGGIGEVSTNPNYRKLGLSSQLLDAATDYMKEHDFDLSMLSTGYFSHYAKHGFMQANFYDKTVVGRDAKFANGEFIGAPLSDIRPLNQENFHDMAMLYNKYCSKLNCCIVRTKDYWQEWCAVEIKNPYGLFKDGKLAGYICFDGNWVSEIVSDECDHDILLSAVKSDDGKVNIPAFVKTGREIIDKDCHSHNMICVYKPIDVDGKGTALSDTAAVVEYLNNNGGIVMWGQDGF
ncbi:MAG: GNAT family N-acetyltransferase [Oscillospiraceae bacterium]|nr:GNAT family N-acetyltransferase [Oscillospiraceae bacterium]